MPLAIRNELPLAAIWATAGLFVLFGHGWILRADGVLLASILFASLFAVILSGAFVVVRHAEALAYRLGEPYGTLVLTLSATLIEVVFIVTATLERGASVALARDTVFSILMITLNGIAGLCLLLGGLKHGEQEHNLQGTRSFLAVIVPVAVLALVLPNFTTSTPGSAFSVFQCTVFALLFLLLYAIFLAIQTLRHSYFFEEPATRRENASLPRTWRRASPGRKVFFHGAILVLTLIPILFLTEELADLTSHGIRTIGAPEALAGVLIAILVLAPEGMGALQAAVRNRIQRAINISLGSALATVGLTIPALLVIGAWRGTGMKLGLDREEMVLLGLTFLVTPFTFGSVRTNVLVGAVHVVLFLVFIALIFDP